MIDTCNGKKKVLMFILLYVLFYYIWNIILFTIFEKSKTTIYTFLLIIKKDFPGY